MNTQAAPELIKHWDGGHSYETIRTIAEGDPTVVGDLGLLGGGPTEFARLADIPQAWKEFCEKYVLGDVNLDNPTQDRNMDKVHYGTRFIYLLSNTRDRVVHKTIKEILTGNAALTARQVPDGKGHQLFLKLEATYGDKEESDINLLKAKFNACDVGMDIHNGMNVELFFTKLEALRNEIGQQIKDQLVINGMDTDGELSFSKMKTNVCQVLGKLPMYTSHVASATFNENVSYEKFKSAVESHCRLMSSGTNSTDERTVAYTKNDRGNGKPLCHNWRNTGKCSYGNLLVYVTIVFSLCM